MTASPTFGAARAEREIIGGGGSTQRPGFSSEIQALRALAVILVVLFHLWPLKLTGGFVGVDVFFAISGFLITGHLLREAGAPTGIALRAFWARRVRRLLPAAVLVLALSLIATVTVLPSRLWQETATQIGASAIGIQNWVLAANSIDYFGANNQPTLVQHYWSLSLEEQFYVVWPVLLLGAFLVARKRSDTARTRLVLAVMSTVFALSFAWSIFESSANPSAAYFSTFTHGWELALGGLLALVLPGLMRSAWARMLKTRAITTVLGFAAILYSGYFFTGHSSFPGWIALLPVLGTLGVIAAGHSGSRIQRVLLLDSPPVQMIGGASYSIYLMHWPLIIIAPFILAAPLGTAGKGMVLVLSIAAGWLSKRFVEDPARRSKLLNRRLWRTYSIGALCVALVVTGSSVAGAIAASQGSYAQHVAREAVDAALDNGNPCFGAAAMTKKAVCAHSRLPSVGFGADFAAGDWGSLAGVTKDGNLPPSVACVDLSPDRSGSKECTLGNLAGKYTVAIVGDSHALALLEPLVRIAEQSGWRVKTFLRNSCSPSLPLPSTNPSSRAECNRWREKMAARIEGDSSIKAVIATGYTRGEPTPDFVGTRTDLEKDYGSLWSRWASVGKRVYVIGDVPTTSGQSVPECVAAHPTSNDPCSEPRKFALNYDPLENSVRNASSTRVRFISLTDQFCDSKTCHAVIGGVIAYRDFHHLSGTFALTLIPALERGLGPLSR